ncbi:serine hydrolase domain-containing protein [Ilumatobacter sp.]|uniref:serine hydrolase domain-containing protein n=1 Tax=Ilumatobacter sp. TaxID=1967498 RepID=UPI003B528A83
MSVEVHGTVASGFEGVRDAFAANWDQHGEVGASVCATVGGETVVDLWGGTATFDDGERDWSEDTIINVWSTTKTMSFLCCLLLADRGELDLHAPVATYWPEFAAAGKEEVATRHVMGHTAGLSGWDEPLEMSDMLDHDKLVGLHAAQAPWWEVGSASGYHAISQGFLLGEIVKRVSGRSLGAFFADEIAGPLGADFHIGTGSEHDDRIAHVIAPAAPLGADATEIDESSVAWRTLTNPTMDATFSSTPEWRRAEIPAAGGHGNARSVAAIHTLTANGGTANGVEVISSDGLERIFDVQAEGTDLVLPVELKLGMGFGLPSPALPLPNPRTCYWGGWGGSLAIIDMDATLSFSYVMNKMGDTTTGDPRGAGPLLATYGAMMAAG